MQHRTSQYHTWKLESCCLSLAKVVQDLQAKDEEISSLKVQVTELEAEKSAAENQLNNAGQKSSIEVAQLQQRLTAQEAKVVDVSKELSILNKQYDEQCQANDELQSHMVELRGSLAETQRHLSNRYFSNGHYHSKQSTFEC